MPQKSPRGARAPLRINEANHPNGKRPLPAALVAEVEQSYSPQVHMLSLILRSLHKPRGSP